MLPGTSPMLLETLAVTGGTPKASSVGNVIKVPEPTTVLIVPAATPANRIATTSKTDKPGSALLVRGLRRPRSRRGRPGQSPVGP